MLLYEAPLPVETISSAQSSRNQNKLALLDHDHTESQQSKHDSRLEQSASLAHEEPLDRVTHGISKALGSLQDKRMAVLGSRARLRERRAALRYQRVACIRVDAEVLQLTGQILDSGPGSQLPKFQKLLKESLALRERLQELGNDYNEAEDRVDREEWELRELESQVYQALTQTDDASIDNIAGQLATFPKSTPSLRSTLDDVSETLTYGDVLERRYQSRLGDAYLVDEQLYELRAERAHYVEEERMREKFGLGLNEETLNFLSSFDQKHNELQADLKHIQEDLLTLRDDVLNYNDALFRPNQFDDVDWPSGSADDSEFLKNSPPRDRPLLLGNGVQSSTRYCQVAPNKADDTVNMDCFINSWLLEILRHSSLAVTFCLLYYEKIEHVYPGPRLVDLIQHYWTTDGTVAEEVGDAARRASDGSLRSRPSAARYTVCSVRSDSIIHVADPIATRLRGRRVLGESLTSSEVLRKATRRLPFATSYRPRSL